MSTSTQDNNSLPQAQPTLKAMPVPVEAAATAAAATNATTPTPQVAVLIPCYNEVQTIVEVVQGFLQALPTAAIYL